VQKQSEALLLHIKVEWLLAPLQPHCVFTVTLVRFAKEYPNTSVVFESTDAKAFCAFLRDLSLNA
jgi:hypothetical protein